MNWLFTFALISLVSTGVNLVGTFAEISSGRIKGDDEPHIVSWRVLEGITEPFDSSQAEEIPAWKQMKNAADQKTASFMIQQALHEYGQLLRHPYMFGDMPIEERYDVFLSMSKLLKVMGFHQRAELLLYEAMSYTSSPHEAHLQLGLLFLDKEDIEKSKMHLKNCLFYKELDLLILIHLAVILIAEGRIFEAKFFLSRILTTLESRVRKLSFILSEEDFQAMTQRIDYNKLTAWVEDLIVKVFYGEFRLPPSAATEMLQYFSNLYQWVSDGEMTGRFVFDLGQSLYEGGRPKIGHMMMRRGYETSDTLLEGEVSTEVVSMRLALDFPVVPASPLHILEAYLNMTSLLSETSMTYETIEKENILDIYWPLPLLYWSALPVMPVLKELQWRFHGGPNRTDAASQHWLVEQTLDEIIESYHPKEEQNYLSPPSISRTASVSGEYVGRFDDLSSRHGTALSGMKSVVIPPGSNDHATALAGASAVKVEVGLLGGHMNNHPTGQMVYRRIVALQKATGSSSSSRRSSSSGSKFRWSDVINLTLLAMPLVPDAMTKRIASTVRRIVNLPMDVKQAWKIIEALHLDVVIFPDWQPFPDQQSIFFQTSRIAPVQICFFVRGSSCVSDSIDYYLLPAEMEESYLQAVPAAHVASYNLITKQMERKTGRASCGSNNDTDCNHNSTAHSGGNTRQIKKYLRPAWKEIYSEQVVLLDWPVMTPQVVRDVADDVSFEEAATVNRRTQSSDGTHTSGTRSSSPASLNSESDSGSLNIADKPRQVLDDSLNIMMFSPLEIEGKVFFDGQPVAVIPVHPTFFSPLMDDTIFKIMRSVPALHLVLALPDSFFTHTHNESKHKMSWARKLVRRLWERIRLLPAPLSDQRLLQLLRQADMVLDTFPIGNSFHLLSLAVSVGTPVVTMRSGTSVRTSKEDMKDIKTFLLQQKHLRRFTSNPMSQQVLHFDMPWNPSISAVAGFYESHGLQDYFVANSTADYFRLAVNLMTNREIAYQLRVRLLEAIDQNTGGPSSTRRERGARGGGASIASSSVSGTGGAITDEWDEFLAEEGELGATFPGFDGSEDRIASASAPATAASYAEAVDYDETTETAAYSCGACVDDLGRFLLRVGTPYARARVHEMSDSAAAAARRRRARRRRTAAADSADDFLRMDEVPAGIGTIA